MWSKGRQLQSERYKIVHRLGGGGFGLTYLATDSFLNRQVVIKTPNDTFQADQDYERYVRRFKREGQTLANINHPNVVSIFGFFEEAGMPCLVMAYVEGETLHERLRNKGPLTETDAVQIFRKLAAALHAVHQAGIFHCDVHPGNVILQRNQEPVLIDFGSAKNLSPATITVTTTINQSFSPYEQQSSRHQPKATLDIYSLSATLFFAVSGVKPTASINRKLYGDTVEFPLQLTTSPHLREAILHGMALEAQDRPQTMQLWLNTLSAPQKLTTLPESKEQPLEQKEASPKVKPLKAKSLKAESLEAPPTKAATVSRPKPLQQSLKQVTTQAPSNSKKTADQQLALPTLIFFSMFLVGNIPTGAGLLILGELDTYSVSGWGYVFIAMVHSILAVVVSKTVSKLVKKPLLWASVSTGAWISFIIWLATWGSLSPEPETLGAIGITLAAPTLAFMTAGFGCIAGGTVGVIIKIIDSLFRRSWALYRIETSAGVGAAVGSIASVWLLAILFALVRADAATGATGGTILGIALSMAGVLLSSYSARQQRHNFQWARIGSSTTALAGAMVGLFSTLPIGAEQRATVAYVSLFQILLIVVSLNPIAAFLSSRYQSEVKPFAIVSAICIFGMACGAVIARMFV